MGEEVVDEDVDARWEVDVGCERGEVGCEEVGEGSCVHFEDW